MHRTIRQLPYQPAIDRPKQKLPGTSPLARPRNVLENPTNLAAREIRIDDKPGLSGNLIRHSRPPQLRAEPGSPPALPNNRGRNRLARFAIPNNSSLALIRNPDRRNRARLDASTGKHPASSIQLRRPNLASILFDPTELWKRTRNRSRLHRNTAALSIVQSRARTRSTFI